MAIDGGMATRPGRSLAWLWTLALASCAERQPADPVAARPYEDPGVVASGEYELRYGTMLAAELAPEIASAYGIDRRLDLVVLSLSVLRRNPGSTPQPVAAEVSGTLRTLLGEARMLDFRALGDMNSVSYLATFELRDRPPIVLQFEARPVAMPARVLRARITREFSLEPR